MIAAGTVDRRLTILRQTKTGVDAANAAVYAETPLRTVWAAKVPVSGGETFDSATHQRFATSIVTFRTYFMSDLTERDRLLCEGVYYDVKRIAEIGRREGLEITAEAQSP
jgi:SPP1 family predicted phage head-tail adaptor